MRRVIIESPYRGDVERNKRYLQACIRDCIRRGESPYASHQMLTDALDDEDPEQRAVGIAAGYEWADVADAFAFYIDLGYSDGMMRARAEYKEKGLGGAVEERYLGPDWGTKC